MNYLEIYGINKNQIKNIEQILEENDLDVSHFIYDEQSIKDILDQFVGIGVTKLYKVIMTNPFLFYDHPESVKKRINKYENKSELAKLIDDDTNNLGLVSLL